WLTSGPPGPPARRPRGGPGRTGGRCRSTAAPGSGRRCPCCTRWAD
ncbi:MAG: hypothetical protein AVDCRST_MAG41-1026, partial [uncultured Corynebacteriales bacterium]